MDATRLHARRKEVVDRHLTLESVPGSGWHHLDAGPRKDRDRDVPKLSDRPVAIRDGRWIYFVGPCADKIRAGVKAFLEGYAPDPADPSPRPKHAAEVCADVAAESGDIRISGQDFNALAFALATPIVSTDAE